MTTALFLMALGMGFFGSPHCLGMCGGVVTAFGLSMQSLTARQKTFLMVTYHFGRLTSYALLGVIAGFVGTTVLQPLLVNNSLPRILLGGVLILIGFSMLGLPFLTQLERLGGQVWQRMSPIRQKVFPLNTFPKAFGAGILWGFLPCGLVYGALMMAVVGRDSLTGAMLMFAFGLGTLPMLVATQGTILSLQSYIKRFRLRQANGVAMALSGLAVIFLPMAMHSLHGHDHAHHHGGHEHAHHAMHHKHDAHSNHETHSTQTHEHHAEHEHSHHANHQHSHDAHTHHHASHENHAEHDHSQHNHH